MLPHAEQQLAAIKNLLRLATPESFAAASEELALLQTTLQTFVSSAPSAKEIALLQNTSFLQNLPSELAHIQRLLQTPVHLLEGLISLRIQRFGSYNRQGEMSSLESSARTLSHL